MFRIMVQNVFCIVMGTPPSASTKKKKGVLPERPTGVFGVPVAAFGCTEEQPRGSLHMHIVLWGGIPPNLLQAAGGIDLLKTAISQAIDAIACGELEPLLHFRHLIRDLQGKTPTHACLYKSHHPIREKKQFLKDVQRVVNLSNVHRHTRTCTKGKHGICSCRLGRPVHLSWKTTAKQIKVLKRLKNTTTVTKLISKPDKTNVKVKKSFREKKTIVFEVDFEVLSEIEAPSSNSSLLRDYSRNPVAARELRQIMYDLKRRPSGNPEDLKLSPEDLSDYTSLSSNYQQRLRDTLRSQNGMVVEYNPLVSTLLGWNTNVSVLGSDAQDKAALSYLIKYVTKPPAERAHSLSLLYHSRRDRYGHQFQKTAERLSEPPLLKQNFKQAE
ncbi:hypothetical protein DAPPUDRAFT_261899 [Daphnia pulex]|uniref:Helitron helicase-like domain-containing protein n=1 Tax=Daphnia pulex TaxID=6669 RepID=E9HLW5_DAPPU|nr:hypothetical protein DAPPUDRAFT_261899 [Daphnia pulex]|eukprot:EFX67269.1 hypothetical protein DAPPUDRAFT_261899 [Daphnia pulex]